MNHASFSIQGNVLRMIQMNCGGLAQLLSEEMNFSMVPRVLFW